MMAAGQQFVKIIPKHGESLEPCLTTPNVNQFVKAMPMHISGIAPGLRIVIGGIESQD
jgi:hypothetical protein